MHLDSPRPESTTPPVDDPRPWYSGLTPYIWFVFIVASLGWLFDTMDQQLFTLARKPAVTELLRKGGIEAELRSEVDRELPSTATEAERTRAVNNRLGLAVDASSGYTTTVFMIGWAIGGVFFGILGDRIGRARTMLATVLCYSVFTGLSALSRGVVDFALYRFLTGLGVGGQFAVGVAMVAEVMPDRSRPYALGWLQALSAAGNMLAALVGMILGQLEQKQMISSSWKLMFLIGIVPALLAIPIMTRLREPDRWKAAARKEQSNDGKERLGSVSELVGDPRWRRNAIVGMILALSGVIGLWGIGFFSYDLGRTVLRKHFEGQGLSLQEINGKLTFWSGVMSLLQNAGGFLGVQAFAWATQRIGRRPAFAISFVIAALSTMATFWFLDQLWHVFVLIPIMGFCLLTLFGGYAIYFPELFPTRLRSTGVSVCYNVGRLVAAVGPSMLAVLTSHVYKGFPEPMRYAGMTMCCIFAVGLLVLPFAPETKGQPLPE